MRKSLRMNRLLVVILNHGIARKVTSAAKESGAGGATVVLGKGAGTHDDMKILGIPFQPEKEVVFMLTDEHLAGGVLESVIASSGLDKTGHGIVFTIDVNRVAGIAHLCANTETIHTNTGGIKMDAKNEVRYDLIITVVNKGDAEKVVSSSKKAGADGGTILTGRGTGIHENAKLFGIHIEPEKEIVLTLINRTQSQKVLEAITRDAELGKPGKGIAFVMEVGSVAGINHPAKTVNENLSDDDS